MLFNQLVLYIHNNPRRNESKKHGDPDTCNPCLKNGPRCQKYKCHLCQKTPVKTPGDDIVFHEISLAESVSDHLVTSVYFSDMDQVDWDNYQCEIVCDSVELLFADSPFSIHP